MGASAMTWETWAGGVLAKTGKKHTGKEVGAKGWVGVCAQSVGPDSKDIAGDRKSAPVSERAKPQTLNPNFGVEQKYADNPKAGNKFGSSGQKKKIKFRRPPPPKKRSSMSTSKGRGGGEVTNFWGPGGRGEEVQKIVSSQATKYVSERAMRHHKSPHTSSQNFVTRTGAANTWKTCTVTATTTT